MNQALTKRFSIFPIHYPNLWKLYKTQVSNTWFVEEVELDTDVKDWVNIHPLLKKLLSRVFAIFNFADVVVCDNVKEIIQMIEPYHILEAEFFYDAQLFIERIHSEMYSQFLETLITDINERHELQQAVFNYPFAKKKMEMMSKYQGDTNLMEKLVNNACGEQIGFSSLFATIFWLRKRNILPGVRLGNSLISQDENLHFSFACELYHTLVKLNPELKLSNEQILSLVSNFVETELQVIDDVFGDIPEEILEDLTKENMKQYVKYMGDIVLFSLGSPKHWKVSNPFEFMNLINLRELHNFFERKSGEYKMFSLGEKANVEQKSQAYSMEVDF
jgi:ribonucleoside-diphosphate reductase subunit M2